ncbi:MAG: class I SAM-dependent methyltransferase [Candidatus Acidiferrales bacterium]
MAKPTSNRARARELAAEFNRKGDPLGWFEALYCEAEAGAAEVPWADLHPNSNLLDFWRLHPQETHGIQALVIGSGLGDDAEQLADWGFQTTGFDLSPTAIDATRKRFPASSVDYGVADLLSPPDSWRRAFDFVLEIYTLQVLPAALRAKAMRNITEFLRQGAKLLVIARGRDAGDPEGQMPWPLTREEFAEFIRAGLEEVSFEDYFDPEEPAVRRFRGVYTRP